MSFILSLKYLSENNHNYAGSIFLWSTTTQMVVVRIDRILFLIWDSIYVVVSLALITMHNYQRL